MHPFGTDELGRDYLTRTLYGGRVSISVGLFTMFFSVIAGTLFGTASGYAGGKVDAIMMRFVDIFMSVPSLLLIIVINTFIKPSFFTLVLMIGLFSWTGIARIVRAETLSLKERNFVMAARNLGVSNIAIIFRHIIPNMAPQIIVAATVNIGRAILQESSLSFLGYGVQLPQSSWGSMLQNAQKQIFSMPLLSFIPGIFILLAVLSFNILGDALRDVLEPGLNRYER
jgi:peptide/nickel transport system permease protein